MKKALTTLLLTSVVSTCLAQSTSSEYERKEAKDVIYKCLIRYIAQLDDGTSSAETVARASVNSCRRENEQFVDVFIRGVYPIDRQRIIEGSLASNMEAATFFVLNGRAEQRKNQK
jgi:hypothetical protein